MLSTETITLIALIVLGGIGFLSALLSTILQGHRWFSREWFSEWFSGISTEMAGAIVSAILLGLVVGIVQNRESEDALQAQLIREMGAARRQKDFLSMPCGNSAPANGSRTAR